MLYSLQSRREVRRIPDDELAQCQQTHISKRAPLGFIMRGLFLEHFLEEARLELEPEAKKGEMRTEQQQVSEERMASTLQWG